MVDAGKINSMITRYQRQCERSKKKEAALEEKRDDLSKHGYWSLGYYSGRTMLYEDIIDDLKDLVKNMSDERTN